MIVVDASVVVQWVVPEPGYEESLAVLDDGALLAPSLLRIELANVMVRKARGGEVTSRQIEESLGQIDRAVDMIETDRDGLVRAIELSRAMGHPIYDCVYQALAIVRDASFATRDKALVRRVQRSGLPVRFHSLSLRSAQ